MGDALFLQKIDVMRNRQTHGTNSTIKKEHKLIYYQTQAY